MQQLFTIIAGGQKTSGLGPQTKLWRKKESKDKPELILQAPLLENPLYWWGEVGREYAEPPTHDIPKK